jgi:SPP1 family predicted phage head-tail adaptor
MTRYRNNRGEHPAPGRLRHRLVIEAPLDLPDGAGGATRGWTVVGQCWARIEPMVADVRLQYSRPDQAQTHRIILRWRADIDGSHRFGLGARRFQVLATADADERRRRLVCICEEIKP